MAISKVLRPQDGRDIIKLIGECRDLGDDWERWQEHWILGLAKLADADLGFSGEVIDVLRPVPSAASKIVYRGQPGFRVNRIVIDELFKSFQNNPKAAESMVTYFERTMNDDGAAIANHELYQDRAWYASHDQQWLGPIYGTDPTLWCFRSIPGILTDERLGTTVCRAKGRRKFTTRESTIVHAAVAAIVPLMHGPLAGHGDPSPSDLTPRARQVLACVLEGDSDKQIAARLKLSAYTVNQYTKVLFQHFRVRSRTQLMARWIHGRRELPFPWID